MKQNAIPYNFILGSTRYNQQMASDILGLRGKNYIFRADKILLALENALRFIVTNLLKQKSDKKILFVTTRDKLKPCIQKVAMETNQLYNAGKWSGGLLTNTSMANQVLCIVLLEENAPILNEAHRKRIPVIALVGGEQMPSTKIQYAIPGNVRSVNFIHFVLDTIGKAIQRANRVN